MNKVKTLSLYEIMNKYKTDKEAVIYFEGLRWNGKVACSKCGSDSKIKQQKDEFNYWCGSCRSYFNVFTNAPMERGKVSARMWLYASYTLMTSRKGISSLQLSKEIGVQQRTAWYMLHRLRLICGSDMEALSGVIEIDETYIGGKEANKHSHKKLKAGRGSVGKVAVMGMRERGGKVKAMPIERTDTATLHGAIKDNIQEGFTIYTDDFRSYQGVDKMEYRHSTVKYSAKEFVNGMAHTNGIESVWAVLKRGYNGIYHNWSKKHCKAYVNEFSFRLNDGNCKVDTQDRLDSLFGEMVGKTITYKELVS